MTNHVHLLVTGDKNGSISSMMQDLGRRYVQRFNKKYHRTGTLWEGRFRSSLVDSEHYVLRCYRYIELNPVRAKMVFSACEYLWSSVQANGYLHPDPIVEPHATYQRLGGDEKARALSYRALLNEEIDEQETHSIRAHLNQGKVLGSPRFQQQIAELTGRSVDLKPIGRPRTID